MRVIQAWQDASFKLASKSFEDSSLEAELLLRHILKTERAQFYANLKGKLTEPQGECLAHLLQRRLRHEPSAYIRGSCEFYGLELYVDCRVLIPRPETELLVDKALELERQSPPQQPLLIADIGTGSGAVAIALAVNLPQARVYAIDVSPQALEVARINCRKHSVTERVQLLSGDLLAPLPQAVDLIVANLPYVSEGDWAKLPPEINQHEPQLALIGGADGLDCIRRLLNQVAGKLHPGGALLLEVGMGQSETVLEMAQKVFPTVSVASDLAGISRVVVAKLGGSYS